MSAEHDQLKARHDADKLIEMLSANVPRLVDVLSLLNERLVEASLVPFTFGISGAGRVPIIGGIQGARLGIVSFFLDSSGAATFQLQQGRGNSWGPLVGMPGVDVINLGANGFITLVGGGAQVPVLISDTANDIAINQISAVNLIGGGVYMTLE